jgi:hypothetical protein
LAARIPGETIRSTPNGDPRFQPWARRVDEQNFSGATGSGDHQIGGRWTENPTGLLAIGNCGQVAKLLAVDDLNCAVSGMSYEDAAGGLVHVPMVEATWSGMSRKLNIPDQLDRHYAFATSF